MKKRLLQDVLPPSERTRRPQRMDHIEHEEEPEIRERPQSTRKGWRISNPGVWVAAILFFIVAGFALSIIFSGAKVSAFPKQQEVTLDSTFEAAQNPELHQLKYQVMTIEREGSETLTATGEETVEEKASGTIVIYNDYSSASQRLIPNTRFETPDGLIFRISDAVVVPGRTADGTPGSVEAVVYADEPGERYNVGLSDFTIPGLQGSPQYEGFFARTKTPLAGGFSGTRLTAPQEEVVAAREAIKARLRESLLPEVYSQKPEGFTLFEDAIFVEFQSLPNEEQDGALLVKEKAIVYGVLFDNADLARFIAENTIAGFDGGDVELVKSDDLVFAITEKAESKPWINDSFSFSLTGNTHIAWIFDEDRLKRDLSGKSKDALPTVLSGYPSILRAEVVIRPFWKSSFPQESRDIRVERILE